MRDVVFISLLCVLPLGLASPTDDTINYCKDGEKVYKEGESWSNPKECQENTCVGHGEVQVMGCAAMEVHEGSGWTISEMDLTKIYPDCCPQPIPPPKTDKKKDPKCDIPKKQPHKKETEDNKKDTDIEADIVFEATV